jgi:hypothetical protein
MHRGLLNKVCAYLWQSGLQQYQGATGNMKRFAGWFVLSVSQDCENTKEGSRDTYIMHQYLVAVEKSQQDATVRT